MVSLPSLSSEYVLVGAHVAVSEKMQTLAYSVCQRGVHKKVGDNIWQLIKAGTCKIHLQDQDRTWELETDDEVWTPIGWCFDNQLIVLRESRKTLEGKSQGPVEVYTIDPSTSGKKKIMSLSYPWAAEYAISPDGRLMIIGEFSHESKIYNFKEHRLMSFSERSGRGFDYLWSRDSRSVLFRSIGDHNLYRYFLDSGSKIQLTDFSPPSALLRSGNQQRLSPDGKRLLALYAEPRGGAILFSIWLMDLNGKQKKKVLDHLTLSDPGDYTFSPDGNHLFFFDMTSKGHFKLFSTDLQSLETRHIEPLGFPEYQITPRIHHWLDDEHILLSHTKVNSNPNQAERRLIVLNYQTGQQWTYLSDAGHNSNRSFLRCSEVFR